MAVRRLYTRISQDASPTPDSNDSASKDTSESSKPHEGESEPSTPSTASESIESSQVHSTAYGPGGSSSTITVPEKIATQAFVRSVEKLASERGKRLKDAKSALTAVLKEYIANI
jgi:hypothetical protein